MNRRTKTILIAGAVAGAAVATVTGAAASREENETPITGSALDQASEAALAETGGGRVTGSEVGDEESYYEVEVTLDNGNEVDVQLDENFAVVGSETDGPGDDEGAED